MTAPPVAVDLRHGPRRAPARIGHGLAEVAIGGPLPFHGIASAALVEDVRRPDNSGSWPRLAPVLEDVLGRLARPDAGPRPGGAPPPRRLVADAVAALGDEPGADREADVATAGALVEAALAAGVLTYAQSAQAAAGFVERLAAGEVAGWAALAAERGVDPAARPARCELWSVREGHTSSVWRVALEAPGWPHPIVFALNVARDREAAAELVDTAAAQAELHRRDPDGIIPVLAAGEVHVATARGRAAVPVVAVPWLEEARELHVVPGPGGPHAPARFFVVERFAEAGAAAPGGPGLRAIGELLDEARSDALWEEHVARCVRMLAFEGGGVRVPAFEPNDGDLVLWGGRSVAVGLGRTPPPAPPGRALLALLLPSAHDDGAPAGGGGAAGPRGRLYWNQPARAAGVIERVWAACGHDPSVLEAGLVIARAACAEPAGAPDAARAEALRRLAIVLGRR